MTKKKNSIILLLCSSILVLTAGIVEAKPPGHAPAHGYRCRHENDCSHFQRGNNPGQRGNNPGRRGNNTERRENDRAQESILRSGTRLEARYLDSNTLVFQRDKTIAATLRIERNINDSNNRTIIPQGSQVRGDFRQQNGEVRFVAHTLEISNQEVYSLNATSDVIQNDRRFASKDFLTAVVSEAARILVDSNSNRRGSSPEVITVNAGSRIDLRLSSDLRINK